MERERKKLAKYGGSEMDERERKKLAKYGGSEMNGERERGRTWQSMGEVK